MYIDSSSKVKSAFGDIILCKHLPYFHLLTPTSQMIKGKFLYIPPTPFYYISRPCPPNFDQSHLLFEKWTEA